MTKAPAISVVMTVYNTQNFLPEAIDSILQQTFKDFEFIIVDNKSTDESVAVIESFDDRRIILVKNHENQGQTKALNIGLKHSRGEFIARMDADDIALPERLAVQYEFMQKNPTVAVAGTWRLDIDSHGRSLRVFRSPQDHLAIRCCLASSGELTNWCITHPTVLIRRKALEEVNGYSEFPEIVHGYPQDYDLWNKMIMKNFKLANIAKVLLKYRVLYESESRKQPDTLLNYRLRISREKIQFYAPGMNRNDVESLARMLEFLPQESSKAGEGVLEAFDRYFDAYMDPCIGTVTAQIYKQRMKLYYLPILFKSNKSLSVQRFFSLNALRPDALFDFIFYRKLAKAHFHD